MDLLVILPYEGSAARQAVEILDRLRPTFGVDLLVRSPEQVRQRLAWNDYFLKDVLERGVTLYAASHS